MSPSLPGGTFDAFVDRLEDGAYAPPYPHRVRPSRLRKGRHRRHLIADAVTARLVQALLAAADQPRPHELLTCREDLLFQCGVLPSAQRGLLGDLQALVLWGAGACLSTGASPHGRPTCDCRAHGRYRCDHDRLYTDPTATWGYDAYREVLFFGYRYFQHVVVPPDHPLPLQILLASGHTSQCTLSPTSLDRLLKLFPAHGLPVTVRAAVHDPGLDAQGLYT